jgi:ABC-2 type transport system permease protein
MKPVVALARKDLRLLLRNRGALFFAFGWPIMMALLFGAIFSGSSKGMQAIPVALVDEDGSAGSRAFVEMLVKGPELAIDRRGRVEAEDLVRKGKRVAWILLPKGFGEAGESVFSGASQRIELGVDPSHGAEAGLIEGIVTRYAFQGFQKTIGDPVETRKTIRKELEKLKSSGALGERSGAQPLEHFLTGFDDFLASIPEAKPGGAGEAGNGWQPIRIERHAVETGQGGPTNPFDITIPQGMIWALLGCAATLGIGLVRERTQGTLERLRTSPLSPSQLLAGRALAAFVALLFVQTVLLAVGLALGVRPGSWALLLVAFLANATAFVGISMFLSVVGRTEESAGGLIWAVNIVFAMFGGGMIPLAVMPEWMRLASHASPAKWAILAVEGAVWRGFGPAEMLLPVGILVALGVAGFLLGARQLARG